MRKRNRNREEYVNHPKPIKLYKYNGKRSACFQVTGTYLGALLHLALHEPMCHDCNECYRSIVREDVKMLEFGPRVRISNVIRRNHFLDEDFIGIATIRAICENA